MIDHSRFRFAGTLVLGLMLALIVGMATPHLTPCLPNSDSIFAAPTAVTVNQPAQAMEAVMVDWSSAVEISATEFEQHMGSINNTTNAPEPYPAFEGDRDNDQCRLFHRHQHLQRPSGCGNRRCGHRLNC